MLFYGKTMQNVKNRRDIKLVTTDKRRNQLVLEPNYHTSKYLSEHLMVIEMKKTKVKMNKTVYLGVSILDISETLMYEFWYDYSKPKCGYRAKLCYTDTGSFIIYTITEDFYKDIANDVERWFDTSNYDENDNRPHPIGKNKKVISLFKDELGGNIMKEFCALGAKTYAYLMDNESEKKNKRNKEVRNKKRCYVLKLCRFFV